MVRINIAELRQRMEASERHRRMPFLCSLQHSLDRPILEDGDETSRGLRTNCLHINDDPCLSAMALSDDSSLVAVASAGQEGTLHFVNDMAVDTGTTYPRFERVADKKLGQTIYSLDWSGNHMLVGSNEGRTKLINIPDILADTSLVENIKTLGEYNAPAYQLSGIHEKPIPDKFPPNSHVKSVEFAPTYSAIAAQYAWQSVGPTFGENKHTEVNDTRSFLATAGNYVNVWDTSVESDPIQSILASDNTVNCASWSPHTPYNLIATGGGDNAIRIIDARAGKVVWMAEGAHARPLCDVRFNPFIPYWLASAGQDCNINFWDIRFSHHAPVGRISSHQCPVVSLSWSNMVPVHIASTSSDGTMSLWRLTPNSIPITDTLYRTIKWSKYDAFPTTIRPQKKATWDTWHLSTLREPWDGTDEHYNYDDCHDPWGHSVDQEPETMLLPSAMGLGSWGRSGKEIVYVGEDSDASLGPVLRVQASKSRLAEYYCISRGGQVTNHSIRLDKKEKLQIRFKYDRDIDPLARQLELDIYYRDITNAKEHLEQLAQMPADSEAVELKKQQQLAYFKDCLAIPPAIQPDEWGLDSLPDKKNRRLSRRLWNADDMWDLAISTFKRDIEHWSRRIPPHHETMYDLPLELSIPKAPLSSTSSESANSLAIQALSQTESRTSQVSEGEMAGSPKSTDVSEPGIVSPTPEASPERTPLRPPLLRKASGSTTSTKSKLASGSNSLRRMLTRKKRSTNRENTMPAPEPPQSADRKSNKRRNALLGAS